MVISIRKTRPTLQYQYFDYRNMDAAVSRRMLDRVIDQVDPDLLQKRSGLLPAKKAAKKDPVIALWIE